MRDIPIDVLLHFPLPNYKHPRTRGPALLYINGILIGITLAFVVLRVYTRVFIKRWMGADDWLILVATIFTVGLTACVVLANERYYWDRHIWDIPFSKIPKLGQIALAAKLFFTFATFFTRTSLLAFYYRLLHDTSLKTYRLVLHAAGIFNAIVFIAFIFLAIFQCSPVEAYWIFPATGKCLNEGKLTLACGIINCFLDLLVTILPIPMVMRLKMRLRQRIGVVILLSLGFVVTIAGIVRTYFIYKSLVLSYDETWFAYPLWIAAAVEVDLAVMCACAPAIRPLLLMYLRPLVTSLSGSRSRSSHNKGDGWISTDSGPSGRNCSRVAKATFEEKLTDLDIVRDDGKTPTVKLSLTKTPQEGKLTIMQRVSWEVDYEDQPKPSHSDDLHLYENEYDSAGASSNISEEERQLKAGRTRSQSIDVMEASRQSRQSRHISNDPNYTYVWTTERAPSRQDTNIHAGPHTITTTTDRDRDTFWRSDSESNNGSTKSEQTNPPEEPRDRGSGGKRWSLRRNPFRDRHSVEVTSPTSRTYEGARVMEMRDFATRAKSPPLKGGLDGR